MLLFIINILFITVLLLFIISFININKYNKNSKLIYLNQLSNIKNKRILDPLIFDININKSYNKDIINKYSKNYYEINNEMVRLEDLKDNKEINIINNCKLINDFNLNDDCDKIHNIFSSLLSCNINYNGSLLQKLNIKINKNNNNILLIGNIFGDCTILIINPKHNDYVNKNKNDLEELKKISIIVNLEKNKCLYIPTNWFYIIENKDLSFLVSIKSDTYLTYFYNKYNCYNE